MWIVSRYKARSFGERKESSSAGTARSRARAFSRCLAMSIVKPSVAGAAEEEGEDAEDATGPEELEEEEGPFNFPPGAADKQDEKAAEEQEEEEEKTETPVRDAEGSDVPDVWVHVW
mmetsp:Transcript_33765/g.66837  ORF Transcript_33765/g.66837 Transcript_33765/m.66837 type:complete len:117 (-) Transcript_33765:315-665(-)